MKKILLVSFSNIGDAVLSLPVLDDLAAAYPESRIDVVAGRRAAVVFEADMRVSALRIYERAAPWRERLRFFLDIRRERYDLIVDLRRSIFGFFGKRRSPIFGGGALHRHERHLEAVRRLGIPPGAPGGIAVTASESSRVAEIFSAEGLPQKGAPVVAIAPGSRSDIKRWPAERFAALADRLSDDGARIVWIGDETEAGLVEKIRGAMRHPGLNLAGRTSFGECAEVIRRADLVITNDSAPLHIAERLGRRVLAFFGPTSPAKYGPRMNPDGLLFRQKFCSPCEKAQCRFRHECMNEITLDEAVKAARRLLGTEPAATPLSRHASHGRGQPCRGQAARRKRFLVVRLDRFGDLVLSMPAVAELRRAVPDAVITALVRPYPREVPERSPDVDEVIVYDYGPGGAHRSPRGYLRLVRELRRKKFDAAFVLHPTARSHWLVFLAGIPVRLGTRAHGGWLLTRALPDRRHEGVQHESENAADVFRLYGIGREALPEFRFQVFEEDRTAARTLLRSAGAEPVSGYVVFHAVSDAPSKRWPAERFVELAGMFAAEWGARIVLIGAAEHARASADIARAIGTKAVDFTGRTPIPVLAALLEGARLLVSDDSGPAHLAAAVGCPVVSIFGRTQPGLGPVRWRPLGAASRFVQKDPGCVICLADDCPIHFECLRQLEPKDVFEAAARLEGRSVVPGPSLEPIEKGRS